MLYKPAHPESSTPISPYIRILTTAQHAVDMLSETTPLKLGRIRGTGPRVSFGSMVQQIEANHPLTLEYPFEGSDRVGGGIWKLSNPSESLSPEPAIAKLRWLDHSGDLPIHIHPSDRFIVVLEGRGFFHWSDQSIESFDGTAVQTIAARSRDVFVFRGGLLHTFSTEEQCMTLLSVQLPYIPFEDPRQYSLPGHRWTAAADAAAPTPRSPRIACLLQSPESTLHL